MTGSATGGLTVTGTAIEILDDDAVSTAVTLTVTPDTVAEGVGTARVTLTATLDGGALGEETVVTVTVGSGTAEADTDFTAVDDFTLTIAAGDTSGTASFTLAPVDDALAEGTETVSVTGSATGGLTVTGTAIEILDDDTVSTAVTLTVTPDTVAEGVGTARVTLTATLDGGALGEETVVTVTVGSETAEAGTDFTAVDDFMLTIAAGDTSGTASFTLAPVDDALAEGTETVSVTGNATGGLTVTGTTVEIVDNDAVSTAVTLTVTPDTVAEGVGTARVTLTATLDGTAPSAGAVVTVTVGSGTAEAGTDFTAVDDFALTIAAGDTSGTASFTLAPVDDALGEGTETVSVTGSATGGLTVTGTAVEILDDDAASTTVTLTAEPANVNEGAGAVQVMMTAMLDGGALGEETVVTVTVGSGTAEAGTDFTAVDDFMLTIAAGDTSGTASFTLAPVDDALGEGNETVTVTGSATGGLTVTGTAVEIVDNDTAPTAVTLTAEPANVNEGAGTARVAVTATLDGGALGEGTVVTVTVGSGTAEAGTDFTMIDDFALTITAGDTSGTASFTLAPVDDALVEDTETVSVTGSVPDGLTVTGTMVEIVDNDTASTAVRLTATPGTVAEGAGTARVTVTARLDGAAPSADAVVTVTVGSGTAEAGTDFTAGDDFALTIAAGDTSGTASFTLAPVDDALVEDTETVSVTGSATGGLTVTGAMVEIVDNDVAVLTVSPATLTVIEGGSAAYTVVLTSQPLGDVTVRVEGASGDVSVNPTILTFTANDWDDPQTVTVRAATDDDADTDASVTLTHTASGGGYDGLAANVVVRVEEVVRAVSNQAEVENEQVSEGDSKVFEVDVEDETTAEQTIIQVRVASGDLDDGNLQVTESMSNELQIRVSGGLLDGTDIRLPLSEDQADDTIEVSISLTDTGDGMVTEARETPPPANVEPPSEPLVVDIKVPSGTYVCLPYDPAEPGTPVLYHFDGLQWERRTVMNQEVLSVQVCGTVTMASPFTVFYEVERVEVETPVAQVAQAWLARFNRTVADQVVEAVNDRLSARQSAGMDMTVAGRRVGEASDDAGGQGAWRHLRPLSGLRLDGDDPGALGNSFGDGAMLAGGGAGVSQALTERQLLTGSAFHLAAQGTEGGLRSLWGRGAYSRFDVGGAFRLDGDVSTGMVGADYGGERWLGGLVLSHSQGSGTYSLTAG